MASLRRWTDCGPLLAASAIVLLLLGGPAGCSRTAEPGAEGLSDAATEDFVDFEDVTPEEKQALLAGKAFLVALAAKRYDEAYDQLSSHARARMSAAQFDAPQDEAEAAARSNEVTENVTQAQFAELMQKVEKRYGPPRAAELLYVESTDPAVLSGRNQDLETSFAIGMMPDSIPAEIRRASLRAQVRTRFTPQQLKDEAEAQGITPEELEADEESHPYFNLKYVLVEENGVLKVGYFEFMPPSILD